MSETNIYIIITALIILVFLIAKRIFKIALLVILLVCLFAMHSDSFVEKIKGLIPVNSILLLY